MEKIDDQIDKIIETKVHIEYLKKDILTTRKRQVDFMGMLFDLYRSKDREIEEMQMRLYLILKDKELQ